MPASVMRRTMLQPANTLIVTLHCAIRTASSPAGAARSTDIGTLILAFREGGEEDQKNGRLRGRKSSDSRFRCAPKRGMPILSSAGQGDGPRLGRIYAGRGPTLLK